MSGAGRAGDDARGHGEPIPSGRVLPVGGLRDGGLQLGSPVESEVGGQAVGGQAIAAEQCEGGVQAEGQRTAVPAPGDLPVGRRGGGDGVGVRAQSGNRHLHCSPPPKAQRAAAARVELRRLHAALGLQHLGEQEPLEVDRGMGLEEVSPLGEPVPLVAEPVAEALALPLLAEEDDPERLVGVAATQVDAVLPVAVVQPAADDPGPFGLALGFGPEPLILLTPPLALKLRPHPVDLDADFNLDTDVERTEQSRVPTEAGTGIRTRVEPVEAVLRRVNVIEVGGPDGVCGSDRIADEDDLDDRHFVIGCDRGPEDGARRSAAIEGGRAAGGR